MERQESEKQTRREREKETERKRSEKCRSETESNKCEFTVFFTIHIQCSGQRRRATTYTEQSILNLLILCQAQQKKRKKTYLINMNCN